MKLKIIEYFWAVGRRTRRTGTRRIPLEESKAANIDRMQFKIEKIEGDRITVSVNRLDGTLIRTLSFDKRNGCYYRPMSMDGGHEYVLKAVRFF
ncbi:MAG: hypothetical protein IJV67_08495 [Clostridia bacterium]|nr:hypothetical protein [Clostridia bacterium]MBQ9710187.1 hypothetical protein [Clostridia bacterium]MBQ9710644.1 hypothetical protein [Clostridia bacterium]